MLKVVKWLYGIFEWMETDHINHIYPQFSGVRKLIKNYFLCEK